MESKTDNEADIFFPFLWEACYQCKNIQKGLCSTSSSGYSGYCFWHTHNLTSNDKHVSLAAVSFTSDDYEDDYVIDPFFVTAAPLLIFSMNEMNECEWFHLHTRHNNPVSYAIYYRST